MLHGWRNLSAPCHCRWCAVDDFGYTALCYLYFVLMYGCPLLFLHSHLLRVLLCYVHTLTCSILPTHASLDYVTVLPCYVHSLTYSATRDCHSVTTLHTPSLNHPHYIPTPTALCTLLTTVQVKFTYYHHPSHPSTHYHATCQPATLLAKSPPPNETLLWCSTNNIGPAPGKSSLPSCARTSRPGSSTPSTFSTIILLYRPRPFHLSTFHTLTPPNPSTPSTRPFFLFLLTSTSSITPPLEK